MFNFLLQGKVGEMMAPVQSPEAQLLIAIQNRQQDKIRDLLEVKGVGANFANDRGVRPMHIACQTGDMRLVQRLLELGADIITADKAGNTPLHYASKGGYTEMVKMLVGQGAAVEKRNGAKLTAYDVATDHVVRQYLLPLQLRAEAGNPDYAVHTMGITSDTPRNYEQYGVPGQPNALHGQPSHGAHAPSAAGPDRMSSALGALMQAPTFAPPRPGPAGMAPPTVYPGGVSGAPPMQPGSASPPPGGSGVGFAGPAAALSPPPPAMGMGALPSSAAPAAPGPALPAPPVNFAGPTAAAASAEASSALPSATAPESVASVEGGGIVTPPRPGDVASQVQSSPPPVAAATANLSPEVAGMPFPRTTSPPPPPPPAAGGSPQAGAGEGAVSTSAMMEPLSAGLCFPEEETPASKTEGVAAAGGARERATPPHSGAGGGGGTAVGARPFSVVPVHVQQQEGAGAAAPAEPLRPGSAAGGAGGDPVMTNVDLSSNFQGQVSVSGGGERSFQAGGVGAALHLPPPAHPSSAPSSGRGAPPPSRPPGAYTPGPGPHQPAAEQQPQGKFKPIKPDGFHSSASDKALQRRYGHTKIVRDMGAPPTAAQLGGPQGPPVGGASYPPPMGGPPPMAMSGPPPMAGPPPMGGQQQPGDGYAQPQARSQYALPQAGYYGQPYGGAGAMQPGYGQQPFAQQQQQPPPPPPPAANQHSAMPAYSRPPPNMNGGEGRTGSSFPSPGGYAFTPAGMGSAAAASPDNEPRSGGGGGGYNVFNPSTDRVVAADSTSNAVL